MNKQIKLLTIRQSSRLIDGFTEYQIRRLVKNGELPYLKSGNRVLIEEQAIYDYVSNSQNTEANGKIIIDEAEFENIKTLAQKQVISVINDKKQKAEIKELRQENQALQQTNAQQHQELSRLKSVRNKLCTNKDVMRVAELEKFQEAVYRFLDKLGLRKQFDDFLKLFNKQRNEMDR